MRKYYIDNIRTFCILLLFPFHAAMCFNTWGEPFYVFSTPDTVLGEFTALVYPWWMTLLFALAGISSRYALEKRTAGEYAKERVMKLLIPFLSGLLLLIPPQSYIADVFHNGYTGNFFEHYAVFFTEFTTLTGYDGGFTPAHLWFLIYLFVISLAVLPLMMWYKKREKKLDGKKLTIPVLLPMFLIILLMAPIFDIAGKSIGEFTACFLLGYFVLSEDEVQDRLEKYAVPLGIAFLAVMCMRGIGDLCFDAGGLLWDIFQRIYTWMGILAVMGLGKHFLNFRNSASDYLAKASFPLYIFHQTVLVITAYFIVPAVDSVWIQFILIMTISFGATMLCYEICRRLPPTRFMFGIKK